MITTKPLLRGHFHQAAFFIAIGACSMLIAKASRQETLIGSLVFSLSLMFLLGVSSLYHRINWGAEARTLMKKLDHVAIYVLIAGTFTPVAMLALPEEKGTTLLYLIWAAASVGVIQSLFFIHAPKWVSAILYVLVGYLILPYLPELSQSIGSLNVGLIVLGGLFYTIGACAYAFKRPNFSPAVFGYHEVFHILVVLGAVTHFLLVYRLVS
jgi:hemolysin III